MYYDDYYYGLGSIAGGVLFILLAIVVLYLVAHWQMFKKMGEPG